MSARTAVFVLLAVVAAGVALWLTSPWASETTGPGTPQPGTPAPGPTEQGPPAPGPDGPIVSTDGVIPDGAPPDAHKEPPGPGKLPKGADIAKPHDRNFETLPLFGEAFASARTWLAKQRAAQAAGDEAAEDAARAAWSPVRGQLEDTIRKDLRRALDFFTWLGLQEDEEVALFLGEILPIVEPMRFRYHMISLAQADSPLLARMLALRGLRGRGAPGAGAVSQAAAESPEARYRAFAIRELEWHLKDADAVVQQPEIYALLTANLAHADAAVRNAALTVFTRQARALSEAQVEAVKACLEDEDAANRELATALLRKQ